MSLVHRSRGVLGLHQDPAPRVPVPVPAEEQGKTAPFTAGTRLGSASPLSFGGFHLNELNDRFEGSHRKDLTHLRPL